MDYVFIAILALGVVMAMPAVIHLKLMGEAAKMIPLAVYVVWLCLAGYFVLAGLIGFLL